MSLEDVRRAHKWNKSGTWGLTLDQAAILVETADEEYVYDGGAFFIRHLKKSCDKTGKIEKLLLWTCSGGVNLVVRVKDFPKVS